jgi:Phosphate transporter family
MQAVAGGAQIALWTVVMLVVLALLFDFMNGFHDAANSIATVVSTGVLKPSQAVAFAAFFNVVAIFVFHLKVAATVGKGIVARCFDGVCGRCGGFAARALPLKKHLPGESHGAHEGRATQQQADDGRHHSAPACRRTVSTSGVVSVIPFLIGHQRDDDGAQHRS